MKKSRQLALIKRLKKIQDELTKSGMEFQSNRKLTESQSELKAAWLIKDAIERIKGK